MTHLDTLTIWQNGNLLMSSIIEKKSITIGSSSDADIVIKALGESALFVSKKNPFFQLFVITEGQANKQIELKYGEVYTLRDVNFLILSKESKDSVEKIPHSKDSGLTLNFIEDLITWSQSMSSSGTSVKGVCEGFLDIIMQKSLAQNGFIVLNPESIPQIFASSQIDPRGAFKALEHLPKGMLKDIIKHGTTVLLPEEIREKTRAPATVFIRGMQSVAGFPIVVNHKVIGIIYLGFKNILRELDPPLQSDLEKIASLMGLIIKQALLRNELTLAKQGPSSTSVEKGRLLLGESLEIQSLYRNIEKVAAIQIPVFILGETGTGKELAAKEIHRYSPRHQKNFVPINCAAIPENLVEGLLFGHKKGSFTGAATDSPGLIEQAHGGTLFLDEIADLPMQIQIKLLRVLQEKKVRRVGETEEREVDFRLISASHKDLKALSDTGEFRIDLYYRVAGATIETPALRRRPDDLIFLANTFKDRFCQQNSLPNKAFSEDAQKAMTSYAWPGNVRELEHVVSRAVALAEGETISREDLGINN